MPEKTNAENVESETTVETGFKPVSTKFCAETSGGEMDSAPKVKTRQRDIIFVINFTAQVYTLI